MKRIKQHQTYKNEIMNDSEDFSFTGKMYD